MPHRPYSYRASAVREKGRLADVRLEWENGRRILLAGSGEASGEIQVLEHLTRGEGLPVFLGSGMGEALEAFLDENQGPVAVVDKEEPILSITGCRNRFAGHPQVEWIGEKDPDRVVEALTRWQLRHGGGPFQPVALPRYLRLDRDFYHALLRRLKASSRFDFWSRAAYAKFTSSPPRVLLLTSEYFLMEEVRAACQRMDVPHRLIALESMETGRTEFVELLLQAVLEFRPDFIFTVNHLGVDREGVLVDLLERLQLPLASWFVDNPHLILYQYQRLASPLTAIFTWDQDNVASLKKRGFPHVRFLPLCTDATRFLPGGDPGPQADGWRSRVSFVGNSMLYKVAGRMKAGAFPASLLRSYREVAKGFGASPFRSVEAFLERHHPELHRIFTGLATVEQRLAYETMITWEATRRYRLECVRQILPFSPLIVGDRGWKALFREEESDWRWHPELNYYLDLPRFYPLSEVNFNCTSMQMKGAVNQRIFDVPACGAFVLTDHREQMDELFEPGKESAAFRDPGEIPELVKYYLDHPEKRQVITQAARQRILACHTYEHRMEEVFRVMRDKFGT